MGKGRKAVPASIHKLHGNYRANRHGLGLEAEAMDDIPVPPGRLAAVGAAEWRRLAPELHKMGVLTALDLTTLEMYCTVYARWINAERMLQPGEEVAETPNGFQQQSAWLLVVNNCIKQMQSLCAEFGMTPATRARIRMIEKQPEQLDLLSLLDQAAKNKAVNG